MAHTAPEIASITGHSPSHVEGIVSKYIILSKYMSMTRELARSAMTKFENAGRTDFANRLQPGDDYSEKNKRKTP